MSNNPNAVNVHFHNGTAAQIDRHIFSDLMVIYMNAMQDRQRALQERLAEIDLGSNERMATFEGLKDQWDDTESRYKVMANVDKLFRASWSPT